MTPNETFIKELEKIEAQITKEISNIISQSKGTTLDRMTLVEEYNIDKRMTELGFGTAALIYVESFDSMVIGSPFVKKISLDFVSEVNLIQKNMIEYLINEQKKYHSLLTMQIENGLMSGLKSKDIIKSLGDIPLSSAQINTEVNTAYANQSRNITREAFKDDKEQRFEYVGPVDGVTSDPCLYAMENQSPEGHTMAEINGGIFPEVNWGGRIPSFNCRHEFYPVDS